MQRRPSFEKYLHSTWLLAGIAMQHTRGIKTINGCQFDQLSDPVLRNGYKIYWNDLVAPMYGDLRGA